MIDLAIALLGAVLVIAGVLMMESRLPEPGALTAGIALGLIGALLMMVLGLRMLLW